MHIAQLFLRRLIRGVLFAVPVALALTACTRHEPAPEPLRSVKVMTVSAGGLQTAQEFSGDVRPRVESRLGFRVGGKLVRREVELGQRVKPGQALAQLDPQDYRLAADAAQAQLAVATTNRDLAAADFKRYKGLREQNFISDAELERREAALKSAQAQVDQAQAQLSSQRNQGAYTTLFADAAGVVTAIEAEPGQVVGAGTPVIRLAQDGPRDAVFAVPEDRLGMVSTGAAVDVSVWPGQQVMAGRIREVSASADPVTRTYQVKVTLDAKTLPPLGATVTVQLRAKAAERLVRGDKGGKGDKGDKGDKALPSAIKLPTSALWQHGQATAVWVLDPKTMTLRAQDVQIATADGNEAVVASGLSEGQQVVTAGVHVLAEGQKVTIYQEKTSHSLTSPPQTPLEGGAATSTPAK